MKRGFIATYTVLIVLVVVTSIALAVTILSVGSGQGSLASSLGRNTLAFVEGCVEDGLERARTNSAFGDPVGTSVTFTQPEGNCTLTINSKVGNVWTMTGAVASSASATPTPTPAGSPGTSPTPTPTPTPGPSIDWPMAGANPQRTSWTAENLPGNISTVWVKPISPYISQRVQVVGAEGKVFVSTAGGLYAFDANSGADAWTYATALPLGHSPTYDSGYLYVGGLDHKIHKVSASTGLVAWTFTAGAGFSTSPIVSGGMVYAGNRDGAFYGVNTTTGAQVWKYQTGNQILQSPAFADNTLYFASNDGYAYALNATSGALTWKSATKLPSMGFYSWWPVIYQNNVIFTRATFGSGHTGEETDYLLCPAPTPPATRPVGCAVSNSWTTGTLGTASGGWAAGTATMDLNLNTHGITFADYFETFPHYRNHIFYNRTTGQEVNFDIDNDSVTDAAPVGWAGDGGTPSPPIVSGFDNVLYFRTYNRGGGGFGSKTVSGWNVGTAIISLPFSNVAGQSGFWPGDEPNGISAAGSKIYWNHCCDRFVGAVDISIPNTNFLSSADDANRQWRYVTSPGMPFYTWPTNLGIPSFHFKEAVKYFWDPQAGADPPCCAAAFWNENDKVGPSVYQGKMYVILGNALVAMGAGGTGSNAPILTSAPDVAPPASQTYLSEAELKAKLEQQVSALVSAGHLKPSYLFSGNVTTGFRSAKFDDYLSHYWHNPGDTQLILLRTLPYLSSALQLEVRNYLQSEFAGFPPYTYAHVGFVEGTQRDPYPYPPVEQVFNSFTVTTLAKRTNSSFDAWAFPPHNVYALWKYAQAGLGNPASLLTSWGTTKLKVPITANATGNAPLTDAYLQGYPLVHNAYIAAYKGYVELAKLAGQTPAQYGAYETELNRLLALRAAQLMTYPNPQAPHMCEGECYYEAMITYFNFAYMTVELADYLYANAQAQILGIINTYLAIAPFWMEAHNAETQGESAIQPYQQTYSLFQALAMIKRAPRSELLKYLDTPIVPVGDLYYIDNLVSTLQAVDDTGGSPTPTPTPPAGPTPTPVGPTPTPVPGDTGPAYQRTIQVVFNRAAEAITIISWKEI